MKKPTKKTVPVHAKLLAAQKKTKLTKVLETLYWTVFIRQEDFDSPMFFPTVESAKKYIEKFYGRAENVKLHPCRIEIMEPL